MLRTGWPMLLGSAMFLVMSWTDTLLLGHFLEEDEVGIYRVAFRMAAVVTLVQAAVNSYAAPLFAERHASGDRTGLKLALRQTTLLNVAFSVPAFVALVAVPAWWLGWFGDAFVPGATCLVRLAVGQVVNALCGPVMYLLNMTGHERQAQRIVWIAAMGNLVMNVWAIPRFGIEGAAVATAFSMALWNVAAAVAVKRLLGLSVWDAVEEDKTAQTHESAQPRRAETGQFLCHRRGQMRHDDAVRAAQCTPRGFPQSSEGAQLPQPGGPRSDALFEGVQGQHQAGPDRLLRRADPLAKMQVGFCARRRIMRGCFQAPTTHTALWVSAARPTSGRHPHLLH